MPRCRVDPELTRTVIDDFAFPLGVYPIETMTPIPGYVVEFEPADAGEEGQFEEWPDRYVFEAVISAERLEPLCRSLFGLLPGRIYPIVDYLGHDQYREVDPYISYDLIGTDRFLDSLLRFRGFFYEDGLCGFGAMVDDPFLYIFVDEHKIVTIRCETHRREKVERILQAFDLTALPQEAAPAGADAAAHEHRTVLITADDRPDLLTADEIVEHLRDDWNLILNVDPESNVDDDGEELGITPWRCLVRVRAEEPLERATVPEAAADAGAAAEPSEAPATGENPPAEEDFPPSPRYIDVILTAANLRRAEDQALEAADSMAAEGIWDEAAVVFADRVRPEMLHEFVRSHGEPTPEKSLGEERIIWSGWLE